MKLNKKGFTLIELIIAITLMLSLTILVIVGYTKISDEKKNEADALTEKQIETAAEQYFSSNYFYVEQMKKDPNAKVFVNLGLLVDEDYLNVTTKTSTEKKYDRCDIVYANYSGTSGVTLNYMSFDKVFDKSSKDIFGFTGSDSSYINYLQTLGLDKAEKNCNAEIFTVSDVIVSIGVDTDYLKSIKKTLNPITINDKLWYKDDVPLLITVSNKDNLENPKNKIKEVNVLMNSKNIEKTELSGSTNYKKIYRVIANNNSANLLSVSASTEGGKSGSATSTYYIDKEAPALQMLAYKTNDTSIANSVPSFNTADNIASNIWINASSNKKNIYLYIKVNDNISGVGNSSLTCTRISDDGADANKVIISTNGKQYNKLYFLKNDKVVTYECEGRDAVGNLSEKQIFTIKRDVTNPTISLAGYYSSNSNIRKLTINNLDKSIKNYSTYSSDNWTNQSVVLKVTKGDNQSGVKTHSCTNPQDNSTFTHWSRVYGNAEGKYNYSCTIEDKAGNTGSTSFVVKRDITKPTCTIKTKGNVKTVKKNEDGKFVLKKYTFDITQKDKTNYTGWYSDKTINISFSSKSDSGSGINSYGLANSSTKSYNSKTSVTHTTQTSGTTWYGYVKDKAGNENKCSRSLKNDYEAPTISKTGAGSVMCLNSDGTEYNAFGYSIKFKDNLSGATARLSRYISHRKCSDGKFDWADSKAQNSSSGSNDKVYTVFAGCDNNPTPEAKFILIDQAGNAYNRGKEVHLKITKSSQDKTKKKCDYTKWFDEYPNRKK